MKHFTNLILIVFVALVCSCSNYRTEEAVGFDHLNDSIKVATLRDEAWARSPESISRHLFPVEIKAGENKDYSIKIDCSSNVSCNVTIIDAGRTNDKAYGQRWNANFEKTGQYWQLTRLTKSVK